MELLDRYVHNGVQVSVESTEADGGKLVIRKSADIEPNIEFAKAIGNDAETWKAGVKNSWAFAGHIPAITVVELLGIGIDIDRASLKEIRAGLHRLGKENFIWKT